MSALEGESSDGNWVRFCQPEAEAQPGPVATVEQAVRTRLD